VNILEPIKQTKLYGLDRYFNELKRLHNNKSYPNKILFSGQKGIGKSTLAFHFINYVLSLNEICRYDDEKYIINIESPEFKTIQNKSNKNLIIIDVDDDKTSINIKLIFLLGSSNIFNKALVEFKLSNSILSIKTNLGLLLNEDLFNLIIRSLI